MRSLLRHMAIRLSHRCLVLLLGLHSLLDLSFIHSLRGFAQLLRFGRRRILPYVEQDVRLLGQHCPFTHLASEEQGDVKNIPLPINWVADC